MTDDTKTPIPDEVLQEQIRLQNEQIQILEQQNAELNAKLKWYEEQLKLQRQRLYGASSEKTDYPERKRKKRHTYCFGLS